MKEQKLGIISPKKFEDKLLLALDADWLKFFVSDPVFHAKIDFHGNYVLMGPKVQSGPTNSHSGNNKEEDFKNG